MKFLMNSDEISYIFLLKFFFRSKISLYFYAVDVCVCVCVRGQT